MDNEQNCLLWSGNAQEGVKLTGLSAALDYVEETRASIPNQVIVVHVSAGVATMQ